MATALKISPEYYFEEETAISKPLSHSRNLQKLPKENKKNYATSSELEAESRNKKIRGPRIKFLEEKFSFLEGGIDALVVNSFDNALRLIFSSLAVNGENIVNLNSLSLRPDLLVTQGISIKSSWENPIENIEELIDAKTKAIYVETLNQELSIPDFQKISAIARTKRIPLIVNNTSAHAGFFSTPLKNGAHIVVNDLTKILSTFDGISGAVVVDSGNFNWNNGNFQNLLAKLKKYTNYTHYLRNLAAEHSKHTCGPENVTDLINHFDNSQSQSREAAAVANALAILLLKKSSVESVRYPGLKGSKEYFNSIRYFKNGYGNRMCFTVKGDLQDFEVFLFNLQRTKVILNQDKRAEYNIDYNKDQSSVSVTIISGTFEDISEDFIYAFDELDKHKKVFGSRFLFQ